MALNILANTRVSSAALVGGGGTGNDQQLVDRILAITSSMRKRPLNSRAISLYGDTGLGGTFSFYGVASGESAVATKNGMFVLSASLSFGASTGATGDEITVSMYKSETRTPGDLDKIYVIPAVTIPIASTDAEKVFFLPVKNPFISGGELWRLDVVLPGAEALSQLAVVLHVGSFVRS